MDFLLTSSNAPIPDRCPPPIFVPYRPLPPRDFPVSSDTRNGGPMTPPHRAVLLVFRARHRTEIIDIFYFSTRRFHIQRRAWAVSPSCGSLVLLLGLFKCELLVPSPGFPFGGPSLNVKFCLFSLVLPPPCGSISSP